MEPLGPEHTEALVAIMGNPANVQYIAQGTVWSEKKVKTMISRAAAEWSASVVDQDLDNRGYYWAVLEETGIKRVIGFVGVGKDSHLRIVIDQKSQGKGYGTEALRYAINHYQTYRASSPLISEVHVGNEASHRLMRKLNFKETGSKRYGNIEVVRYELNPRINKRLREIGWADPWDLRVAARQFPYRQLFLPSPERMLKQLIRDWMERKGVDPVEYEGLVGRGKDKYLSVLRRTYPEDVLFADALTDWYVDPVRMRCSFKKYQSPYGYWNDHREAEVHLNPLQYRENMYTKAHPCNLFNLSLACFLLNNNAKWVDDTIATQLDSRLEHFIVDQRILDPAAGWGDRLAAAIITGASVYDGWDTNEQLQPVYQDIADFLAETGHDRTQWSVTAAPFEQSKLPAGRIYDTILTSPPFYDVELYEGEQTSTTLYRSEEEWIAKYYRPMWEKAIGALRPGGRVIVYISPGMFHRYTNRMLTHEMRLEYLGMVGFLQSAVGTKDVIRPAYIWRKPLDAPAPTGPQEGFVSYLDAVYRGDVGREMIETDKGTVSVKQLLSEQKALDPVPALYKVLSEGDRQRLATMGIVIDQIQRLRTKEKGWELAGWEDERDATYMFVRALAVTAVDLQHTYLKDRDRKSVV